MRLGIIGSSGGAALAAATECLIQAHKQIEFFIVVDRDCGMLRWANAMELPVCKIPYTDANTFSSDAFNYFRQYEVEQILLFYSRRVSSPLIGGLPIFNIHPGLLPAFSGLHGVEQALNAGVKILGASLHGVDNGLDTGPIVAQIATALSNTVTHELANKISFLQKVYLTLVWYELLHCFGLKVDIQLREVIFTREPPCGITMSPSLEDSTLAAAFKRLQEKEDYRVIPA